MATYTFETMSQTDANAFTQSDFLLFASGTVANLGVSDTPASSVTTGLGTTVTPETITLTENGKSLTFSAAELSAGSQNNPDHVLFGNNDVAVFGTSGSDASVSTTAGSVGHGAVAFGFAGADTLAGGLGNDTLNGGDGNDVITGASAQHGTDSHGLPMYTDTDFLLGGAGSDTITGSAANDHIYGNVAVGAAGAADGDDVLHGGAGNDYINGNAGNDVITGDDGNDRLYGGNGNDHLDGGNGSDYIQGNKGNDTIADTGATGNDTIHGGADNDTISVVQGNNQLWGDNGNDTIAGGTGNDTISGGAGFDAMTAGTGGTHHTTFVFAAGDATFSTDPSSANHDLVDSITGFTHGTDHLSIGFTATNIDTTTTTFATADTAYTYAQAVLTGHGTDVVALQVGADTYLFWDSSHSTGTIDSVVDLTTYTASTVTKADFI